MKEVKKKESNENFNSINRRMWPVYYNGELWNKWDCGDVFLAIYSCKEALRPDGAVYVGDGSFVFPDNTFEHDDRR
jgi:hypothetical protein